MNDTEYLILAYNQYNTAQDYIKSKMHDKYLQHACQNASTIEKSNQIWDKALIAAKTIAYAGLDIRVRQDVIDRIVQYWAI